MSSDMEQKMQDQIEGSLQIGNLTDAELSLAVAQIMWPMHFWKISNSKLTVYAADVESPRSSFTHTTDDALGKMCVWLANNRDWLLTNDLGILIEDNIDNPHRAIAAAILEASK